MPEERAPNPAAEPAPASSAPVDDGFAADLAGPALETPSAAPREPAKPAFDPNTVDWHRTKPEDIPPEYRPAQTAIKQHLAQQTRAEQEAAQLRERIARLESSQQAPQSQQALVETLQQLVPKSDRYQDLRERLSPEEAPAIDVVREIIAREMAQAPTLEPLQKELGELRQYVALLIHNAQQQAVTSQASDLQAVVGKYGEDRIRTVAPSLKGMLQVPNPETGRAYTLAEAADMILGRSVAATQEAQTRDAAARNGAKRQVAPVPTSPAPSGQAMTNEQVLSELENLGFNRR